MKIDLDKDEIEELISCVKSCDIEWGGNCRSEILDKLERALLHEQYELFSIEDVDNFIMKMFEKDCWPERLK